MRTGSRQAARALSRMLRKTCTRRNGSTAQCRSTPSISSRRRASSALAGRREVLPRLRARLTGKVAGPPFELDRGRVTADVLVEVMEVVLRILNAVDQVEGFGPVSHLPGQHLQASLAALARALRLSWARPGDHLADGRQPLRLERLLLGLLQLGDVLPEGQDREARPRSPVGSGIPDDPPSRAVAAEDRDFQAARGAARERRCWSCQCDGRPIVRQAGICRRSRGPRTFAAE